MDRKCPAPLHGSDAPEGACAADLPAIPMHGSRRITTLTFLFLLIPLLSPAGAPADVLVQDLVSPAGQEVMLRAETKSGFFSKGGALVEFVVDGKPVGKSLSGGDGLAFRSFVPGRPGLQRIMVQSEGDSDEGLLLAVRGSTQLVFIDVESSLHEPSSFALKPRSGSVQAVKKINRTYPVVYLGSGFVGLGAVKSWLKEMGFPEAPLLAWGRGEVFREAREKHLKIRAVIGNPDVVKSAEGYTSRIFSFDAAGDREAVQDWDEIVKKVK
jgi:hypothetical protein